MENGRQAVGFLDWSRSGYDYWRQNDVPNSPPPTAILLEALAKVGAVAVLRSPENQNKIAILTAVNKWYFHQLGTLKGIIRLEAELTQMRHNYGTGHARTLTRNFT